MLSGCTQLIWNRFIACQMNPAIYDQTTVDIERRPGHAARHRPTEVPGLPRGFARAWTAGETPKRTRTDDGQAAAPARGREGEGLRCQRRKPRAALHPAAAALHRGDAGQGAGGEGHRPAVDLRGHPLDHPGSRVRREEGGPLHPTVLGSLVTDLLVESFPDIMDVEFTAQMEDELDEVEEGTVDWIELLRDFYGRFKQRPRGAPRSEMRDVKREEIPTEHICEKCGKPMVIKWGRNGEFLACSGYPECRNTKEFKRKPDGRSRDRAGRRRPTRCARSAAGRWWSSAAGSGRSWPARAIPSARGRGRCRSASPARRRAAATSSSGARSGVGRSMVAPVIRTAPSPAGIDRSAGPAPPAAGYLSKDIALEQLIQAIRRVASGKVFISQVLAESIAQNISRGSPKLSHEHLSDGEYQIMIMIARGKSLKAIGAELSVSVKTVSTHRSHILEKMKLENNAQIVTYALQNGLLT